MTLMRHLDLPRELSGWAVYHVMVVGRDAARQAK
jgi:hypothetical protein